MSLYILGMGWHLPKNLIDNDFLHKEVGLERGQDWVDSRLGINKRYSVLSREYILRTKNKDPQQAVTQARAGGETPITMGVKAARMALERAGVKASEIGRVVVNNDTPFEVIPSSANLIAKELGIAGGSNFDMNTACSSFALHMHELSHARAEALPELVLCVQTSCYTTRTDYSAKSIDGYIWGDGAAAQVCSARRPGKLLVEPMMFETNPGAADEILVDTLGHFTQNGAVVREFSIRKTCEMFEEIAQAKGLHADTAYTIAHQANFVMQNSILGHLHLPAERHLRNVREQGNIAAAGCPSVLAQNWDKLKKGDQIAYAVLGAGLAWGGGYMEVVQ